MLIVIVVAQLSVASAELYIYILLYNFCEDSLITLRKIKSILYCIRTNKYNNVYYIHDNGVLQQIGGYFIFNFQYRS